MNDYELELKEYIEFGYVTNLTDLPPKFDNKLSEEFITKYFGFLNIKDIIYYQTVSEQFLENNIDKFDTNALIAISSKRILSQNFIRKFPNKINWLHLYYFNKSENFIEEFQDKVLWDRVFSCCILSESFIRKFQNKINFLYLRLNKTKFSQKFILEFKNDLNFNYFQLCYFPKIKHHNSWKTFL